MIFQAIMAPALVICGALLYGSNLVLATGTSICGRTARFGRPFVGFTFSCRVLGCYVKGLRGVRMFVKHVKTDVYKPRLSALPLDFSDLTQELLWEVCRFWSVHTS